MRLASSLLLAFLSLPILAEDTRDNAAQTILVTFENSGASRSAAAGTPYRFRKRYGLSASARRFAQEISSEYGLTTVDDWPIKSLSVYCFVFRVAESQDPDVVLDLLKGDARVESAQAMNQFETGTNDFVTYDDAYVGLQRGLDVLDISSAHIHTRGSGVRIAVIDSNVDVDHEDLRGRVRSEKIFAGKQHKPDRSHGTAIASVIGASANNAKGIVGVAPEAELDLLVSCWANADATGAICDSFSLAKALDAVAQDPPQIVNMSLSGPYDPLLHRLIEQVYRAGVILVAADNSSTGGNNFPASADEVIAVGSSDGLIESGNGRVHAPAEQIIVAVPNGGYQFQSGTSIAAAHVSGVVALLLSASPDIQHDSVQGLLEHSQGAGEFEQTSVDACKVLHLANASIKCRARNAREPELERQPGT